MKLDKKSVTLYIDRKTYDQFLVNAREMLRIRPSILVEVFMKALNDHVAGVDPIQPMIDELIRQVLPLGGPGRPRKIKEPD